MPLLDLPVDQLLKYEGRNPRPADFDSFWDNSLAEMHALDPQIELTPHHLENSFADCYDLRFRGTRGGRVHAKYLRPRHVDGPVPCLLHFHGYGAASEPNWITYFPWVARGYAIVAMDCRGQGGLSDDLGGVTGSTMEGLIIRGLDDALKGEPEKLYFRNVFLDSALLAKVVSSFDEVDGNRLGAFGSSQGGALTLVAAALADIKLAAPVHPFLADYKRVWEMDRAENAYGEIKTYFRQSDPRHEKEHEIFETLGYIDIQFLMPRVKSTVLLATGLVDSICPPSSQFAAYNKILSPKDYMLFPDYGHEPLPGFEDKTWEFMGGL